MDESSKDDALKTLVKGAGFVYVGMVLSKLLTYLYRIIIARISTSEYGLFSLGLAAVSMAMYIPLLGLDQGVVRYVSYYLGLKDLPRVKGTITSALKIVAPLSILSMILLFLGSNYLATNFWKEPRLGEIIRILSIAIPFYAIGEIYLSFIKAYKRMDYWVIIRNIFENFIKFSVTYILILTGLGATGAAIGFTVANVISLILAAIVVEIKILPIIKSKIVSIKQTQQLLLYSWPIMFNIIFGQIYGWIDTVLIGYFKTTADVGIYNAALPTAQIINIVPTGIMALFVPVMTSLYAQKKKDELQQVYKTSTKWAFYLIAYIYLVFIIFSKDILTTLFGASYESGAYSFMIIATGFFVYSFLGATDVMLKVIDRTKLLMLNTLISTIINVTLNVILIPKYGFIGGAIASATSVTCWSTLCLIESYYLTKMHPFKKEFLNITLAAACTSIITVLLKGSFGSGIYGLIEGGIISSIVYLSFILIFKCLDSEDIKMLKTIACKILSYTKIAFN
jgi:O-antigen/teichoic acid export membrane protein